MDNMSSVAFRQSANVTPPHSLFNDQNIIYTNLILEAVKNHTLQGIIADIDGSLGHLTPGDHICTKPLDASEPMITLGHFFPTGLLTGRPQKVIDTGFQGLLDTKFGFAGTEAGARLMKGTGLVYEHAINGMDILKDQFSQIVATLPGAMIEEHTMCSIIVGLTKVDQEHHPRAFEELERLTKAATTPENPIAVVSGNKPGINVHYNVVSAGIDKGMGIRRIYDAMGIGDGIAITIGDDKADKPMFDYVMSRGGIAIGVGEKAPESQIRLDHPREAVALLNMMALALR